MRFFLSNPNGRDLDCSKVAHQLYGLGYHPLEYYRWYMRIPLIRMMYGLAKLYAPESVETMNRINWSCVFRVVLSFVVWQLRKVFGRGSYFRHDDSEKTAPDNSCSFEVESKKD